MKNHISIPFFIFAFLFIFLKGQTQSAIPSYSVSVSVQKTTNLLFPYAILKADIGSGDVIGRRDEKLKNVLFLKANKKKFEPTNLSIYTADGKFYSFIIGYQENPDTLNLSFTGDLINEDNQARLDSDANTVTGLLAFLQRRAREQGIRLDLNGIYTRGRHLWFHLNLLNDSPIAFQMDDIRFFVRDRQVSTRTATQEHELVPIWNKTDAYIPACHSTSVVLGFPLFTISQKQEVIIQLREKNGGRPVKLQLRSRMLLNAKPF